MSTTTNRAKLIEEALDLELYAPSTDVWKLVYRLATALAQSERELTEQVVRNDDLVQIATVLNRDAFELQGDFDRVEQKLTKKVVMIEEVLKITDDMRSIGWHIGKTVPDLGQKIYEILSRTSTTEKSNP